MFGGALPLYCSQSPHQLAKRRELLGLGEVPVCARLLPAAGMELAMATAAQMSAHSVKAEEGFPYTNSMWMKQRKLKKWWESCAENRTKEW